LDLLQRWAGQFHWGAGEAVRELRPVPHRRPTRTRGSGRRKDLP
jgi:hypothetical protein